MKKIVKVLFCLVAIVALASCGSNKLPEWADTEVLTENARVLIDKHPITKPLLHNDLAFAMLRRFETLYFKPPFSALKIGIRGAC